MILGKVGLGFKCEESEDTDFLNLCRLNNEEHHAVLGLSVKIAFLSVKISMSTFDG